MNVRRLAAAWVVALLWVAPAHAQETAKAEKEAAIRRLLDVTGMVKLSQQIMDQMLNSLRTAYPQVPAEAWTRFREKTRAESLVDKMVPIYDKYYSKEDVEGIITFYETPLGKKLLTTSPQIVQESMKVGQEWGQQKMLEVVEELGLDRPAPRAALPKAATPAKTRTGVRAPARKRRR